MLIPELDDVIQTLERNTTLVREMAGIIVQTAEAQDAIMGRINGLMRYAQGVPLEAGEPELAPVRVAAPEPEPGQSNGNHYPGADALPAWSDVLKNIGAGPAPPPVPQRVVAR